MSMLAEGQQVPEPGVKGLGTVMPMVRVGLPSCGHQTAGLNVEPLNS